MRMSRAPKFIATTLAAFLPATVQAGSLDATAVANGAWSDPSVWSGAAVPGNGTPGPDDVWNVTLDNAVAVVNDVTTTVESLTFADNGVLASVLGGGTGAVSVSGTLDWRRGVLGPAGFATFEVLAGARAELTTSGFKFLRQRLLNRGTTTLRQGVLAGNTDARITNASGGLLTLAEGSILSVAGLVRNEAGSTFRSLAVAEGAGIEPGEAVVNQVNWTFDSEPGSFVQLMTSTEFNGGGTHRGHYELAPDALLQFGFVGTTHTFAPQSVTSTAPKIRNAGATVVVPANAPALPVIREFTQSGGMTTFGRDIAIDHAILDAGAVVNASGGVARFDGDVALQATQLGGTNGKVAFGSDSSVTLAGSNVVDTLVEQSGTTTMNGGELFIAPNGTWVVLVGSTFSITSPAAIRRSGLPAGAVGVFQMQNGALVRIDVADAEADAAMHNLVFKPAQDEIVVFSPLQPELTGVIRPRDPSPGAPPAPAGAALSTAIEVDPAAILVARGRLVITEALSGPFDIRVRRDGTFLTDVQPDGLSRLIGNGSAGRTDANDMLEWRGIVDPLAPEGEGSVLTFLSHLRLVETSILRFDLGSTSDRIVVEGNVALDGRVDVHALDGFGPGAYTLAEWRGAVTDLGLDLTAPDGFTYELHIDSDARRLVLNVTTVPEPGTRVLLLAGAAGLALRGGRRALPRRSGLPRR